MMKRGSDAQHLNGQNCLDDDGRVQTTVFTICKTLLAAQILVLVVVVVDLRLVRLNSTATWHQTTTVAGIGEAAVSLHSIHCIHRSQHCCSRNRNTKRSGVCHFFRFCQSFTSNFFFSFPFLFLSLSLPFDFSLALKTHPKGYPDQ